MSAQREYLSMNVKETQAAARYIATCAQPGDVFVLSGDLGAGKTHFAQGFARGMGVARPVASPTFNIVLEYPEVTPPLYHFDVYRLDEAAQLEDIDFYALVESEGVSLIEWGEKFNDALSEADVRIVIGEAGETSALTSSLRCGVFAQTSHPASAAKPERTPCSATRRIITLSALSVRGEQLLAALDEAYQRNKRN